MKQLISVYLSSLKLASGMFIKNWMIIPAIAVAFFSFLFVSKLVAPLGILGGFINGLLLLSILTYYYSWIKASVDKQSLTPSNMLEFDSALFFQLMSIGFIFWITEALLLEPMVASSKNIGLYAGIKLLVFFLFNCVVEVAYIRGMESVTALQYSLKFVKETWIEWFLPMALIISPALISFPVGVLYSFARTDVMAPGMVVLETWRTFTLLDYNMIFEIVALVLVHLYTLFRGFLFQSLDSGKHLRKSW